MYIDNRQVKAWYEVGEMEDICNTLNNKIN